MGSDSISPDQQSRTRFPLGDGSGVTTCPGEWSAEPKQLGSRTSHGVPDPHILSGPLSGEGTDTPPKGVRSRHMSAGAGTRAAT